jgi:hypothetical protein
VTDSKVKYIIEQMAGCAASGDWDRIRNLIKDLVPIIELSPELLSRLIMHAGSLLERPEFIAGLLECNIYVTRHASIISQEAKAALQRILTLRLDTCFCAALRRDREALCQESTHLETFLVFSGPLNRSTVEALLNTLWRFLRSPEIASSELAWPSVYEAWLLLVEATRPLEVRFKKNICRAFYVTEKGSALEYQLLELLIDLFPNKDTVDLLGRLAAPAQDGVPLLSASGIEYGCTLVLGSYPDLAVDLRKVLEDLRSHSDRDVVRIVRKFLDSPDDV